MSELDPDSEDSEDSYDEFVHDCEEYIDDDKYEYGRAPFAVKSRTSKESQPDIFAIAEIAWLVSRFLDDALGRIMAHLRSLDLECGMSDPECFKFFERCDSLTRLHVCADDDDLDVFYDNRDVKEYLHPLISTIRRQHHLTQLELNIRLVWQHPETFLSAFLALQQLRLLRVYMAVEGPTIPEALTMVMDLLNEHPRLGAIRFGDWYCNEDSDDERSYDSDEDYSHFSDEDEDEDEIGNEETETFNKLERQLRANGYPMITNLELPPRHPFSALAYPTFDLSDFLVQKQPWQGTLGLPFDRDVQNYSISLSHQEPTFVAPSRR
ncbi:hypothetical protein CPB97_010226 [Podila verticillata]|nr:hypothetical protein CPB97_010226 [Podila verticillata]